MHSYQVMPSFASISSSTFSGSGNGWLILYFTIDNASSDVSYGPSKINSSWICKRSFHPNSFNSLFLWMFTIAAMTMSAAPPWIGVLIALLNPMPIKEPLKLLVEKNLSRFLYLPSKVWVILSFLAIYCLCFCHYSTSGRSLNQALITFLASSIEQFQSSANPCAVFP